MSEKIIEQGILKRMEVHSKTLKARASKKKQEQEDKEMAGVRQEQRRAERKIARETRAKEQAKNKMRDEIRRMLIDKGQVCQPVNQTELMEIHGCYEKGKQYLGAVGGQLQQLYYVINSILKLYDERNLVDYY